MTMQMTRLQHDSAETATGRDAHPTPEERLLRTSHTPQRDAVTAHLDYLAARIGRLEVTHAGQQAAPRGDTMSLQVTISHLAPLSTTHPALTTVRMHGP